MRRMTRKFLHCKERKGFKVKVTYLHPTSRLDSPAKVGDSGFDIHAWEDLTIPSALEGDGACLIPTGICIQFPKGYSCTVENKSGVALNKGLLFVNGIIDSGYRGEIKLIVYNMTKNPIKISEGDKIAQLCFYRNATGDVVEVENLDDTERGSDGFGSTSEEEGTREEEKATLD